jgi:hypothetical protein
MFEKNYQTDIPRERNEKREKEPEDFYPTVPKIPMKLEKQIAEKGIHLNEKSKSKTAKGKPKKNNSKSNRSTVEKV